MEQGRTTRRDRSRALRRAATEAEKHLWWHLRRRLPLTGTSFRRQVAIGAYYADFCCLGLKVVVDIDGEQHGSEAARAYDAARTRLLTEQGFVVLRFWNHQVFHELDAVLDTIAATLAGRGAEGLAEG